MIIFMNILISSTERPSDAGTSSGECCVSPENSLRKANDMPEIRAFIRHYIVKPWRKKVRQNKVQRAEKSYEKSYEKHKDQWLNESRNYV